MMDSMALWPTFLIAARPKPMALPVAVTIGVKLASETCTLGGTTGMFISRHSEMYLTTFSGFEVSDGEERGHELDGIVGLEPRGVIGEQRVGGGVGLVEAVSGELLHQVEDFAGLGFGEACARLRRP